jgi:hypothetical protein
MRKETGERRKGDKSTKETSKGRKRLRDGDAEERIRC